MPFTLKSGIPRSIVTSLTTPYTSIVRCDARRLFLVSLTLSSISRLRYRTVRELWRDCGSYSQTHPYLRDHSSLRTSGASKKKPWSTTGLAVAAGLCCKLFEKAHQDLLAFRRQAACGSVFRNSRKCCSMKIYSELGLTGNS